MIHILHIEDNEADSDLVQEYLSELSIPTKVTHVKTLDLAYESLQNDKFQIVLLDLMLPDSVDPALTIKAIRDRFDVGLLVILTGSMDLAVIMRCYGQPQDVIILKNSLSPSVLLDLLNRITAAP